MRSSSSVSSSADAQDLETCGFSFGSEKAPHPPVRIKPMVKGGKDPQDIGSMRVTRGNYFCSLALLLSEASAMDEGGVNSEH